MKASRAQAKMLKAVEELAAGYTALAEETAKTRAAVEELAAAYTELAEADEEEG